MTETDHRIETARKNLRIAVAIRKTNLAETARKAGLSRNALQQFVAGKTQISYANMLKVCDVLQVPIGTLHRPDGTTETRLRLYKTLERLPDHLAARAISEAQDLADRPR